MMTEFKRTQRDYPLSFKIAVVEQVEKGEMTYKQAQQRYGIQLANQKADFFESVINVLKNDYGVSIVKKRPGKSSRKVRPPK